MKIKIGKIIRAKGLQGKLKVFFLSDDPSWVTKLKHVYLGKEHKKIDINSAQPTTDKKLWDISFQGVIDREKAETLKGEEIFLEEEFFKSSKGENLYLRELMGFLVKDKNFEFGQIIGFGTNGAQDLIEVKKTSGEITLVPLVKEFIEKIDMKEKVIFLDLPEGF
ncbi:MAG: 16S rRNA processing protein RimM [Oligoflexia bacterium]|nr:16S rRNA processing protein RimM [Oligoflexia bacterium]